MLYLPVSLVEILIPGPSPKNGRSSFFEEGCLAKSHESTERHPSSFSHGFRENGEGPGMRIFRTLASRQNEPFSKL
jgi:hypothetical protein